MAIRYSLSTKGGDEIRRKIEALNNPRAIRAGLTSASALAQRDISEYPPSTIANTPQNGSSWYVRGWGTKYAGGGGRRTSENLDKRWASRISNLTAEILNNASYSDYVHGQKQARFHKRRGWVSGREWLKTNGGRLVDAFRNGYRRITKI